MVRLNYPPRPPPKKKGGPLPSHACAAWVTRGRAGRAPSGRAVRAAAVPAEGLLPAPDVASKSLTLDSSSPPRSAVPDRRVAGSPDGLDERVVPVVVLAVHAPRPRAVRARRRPAHAVDQVCHLARRVKDDLGPLPRRHGDGARRRGTAAATGLDLDRGLDLDLVAVRRDGRDVPVEAVRLRSSAQRPMSGGQFDFVCSSERTPGGARVGELTKSRK